MSDTIKMDTSVRALAWQQCRCCRIFWLALLFLIMGRCRAADIAAAAGGRMPVFAAGSEDRIFPTQHPKAPPRPRQVPPNSTLFKLELEQGEWRVAIENDASNSEARFLVFSTTDAHNVDIPTPAIFYSIGERIPSPPVQQEEQQEYRHIRLSGSSQHCCRTTSQYRVRNSAVTFTRLATGSQFLLLCI